MAAPIPIIVFLLVLSAVSSSSSPTELEDGIRIVFVEKRIHLTGPLARVKLTLEVENDAAAASDASRVLVAFTHREVRHLAIVSATRVENKPYDEPLRLRVVHAADFPGARLYSLLLGTHLKPGEGATLQVVYVLTQVLDPYPAKAVVPSAASQLVYYHDSAMLLSPYHVQEQVTYIETPGKRIEWWSTPEYPPTSRAGAEVKYGAYYDKEPGTFAPISLQYEHRPFVVFEKLERRVDIPLRGHIRVTDQYKMRQENAWYKRLFSSPECPRIWPAAHELVSSNKDRLYLQLIQGARYGWHCTFAVGYGLPEDSLFQSEDGRRYINLTFGVPLLDTVVNDFTTMVLLPEGSKNPQPIVPFPMEVISRRTYWQRFWELLQRDDAMARLAGQALESQTSYSYVAGRAALVLRKKKLVAEHNVPFQVYYESNPIFTRIDPITLFLFLVMGACLCLLCYESGPILMMTKPLNLLSALVCIACWIIYFYFT